MPTQSLRSRWVFALALGASLGTAPAAHAQPAKYPFANPPLEIYDQLVKSGLGKPEAFVPNERAFLAAFWNARTGKFAKPIPGASDTAVMVHFIASGVSDSKTRDAYLKKFTDLVAAAKAATVNARSEAEKADLLLRFLHKEVMSKGYVEKQSDLSTVFDTGKFNCVSSSCLYYLVGIRLGLPLQPILIPGSQFVAGHAAVDFIAGESRIQIEPTNPNGFDWQTKLKQPGVVAIGFQPDRKKAYDSDGFGLAASIASNRCAELGKANPGEAIRWAVVSLVLDPTDPAGADNLIATIDGWAVPLANAGKIEDALSVYGFAQNALGTHKGLTHNHGVIWEHYLDAAFGAGQIGDGQKLLARAAVWFPNDKRFARAGDWVARAAQKKAEKDGWPAGFSFADTALQELTGDNAALVRGWKEGGRRLWSQGLLDKGEVAGSLQVLAEGLRANPDSKELIAGLSYHTNQALRYLDSKKGTDAAIAHFKELTQAYPKVKEIRDQGFAVAASAVSKLTDGKKFDEALKAVTKYEPLAGEQSDTLRIRVYDQWAISFVIGGDWEAAIKKYTEGLVAFPKSTLLRDNAIVTVNRWGMKAIDKKDWNAAIERYDLGLQHFPDSRVLKDNRDYCIEERNK